MRTYGLLQNAALALLCSTSLGAVEAKSRFQYYDMPTALAGPCDLSTGPDGNIWVSDFLVPKVARINPKTGHVKEFTIPYTAPVINRTAIIGPLAQLAQRTTLGCVSQPGEDGKMYFASGLRNQFAQMDIKTNKIKVFTFPNRLGNLEPLNDMWRGPTGMFISQTTDNTISLFDYKTHKIKNFTPPTPVSGPVGLYLASDGCIWFCEFLANKMGRLNFTSGEIRDFPLPLPLVGPAVTRVETKTNGRRMVWATGFIGNKMVSIDIDSFKVELHNLPQPLSLPVEDTVDSKGFVWYSSATYNTINRLNPKTGHVKVIPTPGSSASLPGFPPSADIAVHYGPRNSIWFTELAKNRVGRLQLK